MLIKYNEKNEVEWAKSIGGNKDDYIDIVLETKDEGYIVKGRFESTNIEVGNDRLTNKGSIDVMLIKYSYEGNVEWAKSIGGNDEDYIYTVLETKDRGYILGGSFYSSKIELGEKTLSNANGGNADGMVIKYNNIGEVEWAKSIGGDKTDSIGSVIETKNGEYIACGKIYSREITIGSHQITNKSVGLGYNDSIIIKYNNSGEEEWVKQIGGERDENIYCALTTSDEGYIIGGTFTGEKIQIDGNEITNKSSSSVNGDGILIKYNNNNEIEWITTVEGADTETINNILETKDRGYIVKLNSHSKEIKIGNHTLTNAEGSNIIKCDINGVVQWSMSLRDATINSIVQTKDEGYMLGGYFNSNRFSIGGHTIQKEGAEWGNNTGDGMLIKCGKNGEVEYATSIGGTKQDYINNILERDNGEYIIGGYFESTNIKNKKINLDNKGNYDIMLIGYKEEEIIKAQVEKIDMSIGGNITGGIQVDNGDYIWCGSFESDFSIGEFNFNNNSDYYTYCHPIERSMYRDAIYRCFINKK